MDLQSLKDGMGFHASRDRQGGFAFGSRPSHHSPPKLTSRDRDLIREIYKEGLASKRQLALAFGVSYSTVHYHTD